MGSPTLVNDAEIRHVVRQVTLICMSNEFRRLQAELLSTYRSAGEPEPETAAFQDALFSLMAECGTGGCGDGAGQSGDR